MRNYEIDLRKTAFIFTNKLLNLQQGERLLIYADQGSDPHVARVIRESAQQIGAQVEIFELNPTLNLPGMAEVLTGKIEGGAFEAICELSEQYFYQTPVWKKALQLGSRIYSLAGLDADAFIMCIGRVDHSLMFQFGMTLRGILKKAKHIQILSKNGTDIQFQMNTNLIFRFISGLKRKNAPYIMYPSGKPVQKGQASFMGGQLAFLGILETIKGFAVIDGYLWPPKEVGYIDDPIILKIEKGSVTGINGHPKKSEILNQWFLGRTRQIQHFCIGFNPGAGLSGKILEAERVFGCISIGIGEYPFHTDGIIKSPSIVLNKEIIEKNGSFIHKELMTLEKGMMNSRYH